MDSDIITSLIKNTENTFLTMANVRVEHADPIHKEDVDNIPDLHFFVKITENGETVGKIGLYMTPECSSEIAGAFLGGEDEQASGIDAIGKELLNIITGSVKNVLLNRNSNLSFSFPIFFGENSRDITDIPGEDIIIPWSCNGMDFFLEVIV